MNLPELIAWHERQLSRLERSGWTEGDVVSKRDSDALAAVHFDAIRLLRWCVELPAVSPDACARGFAFETVLEQSAWLAGEPSEDDAEDMDRMFWKRLNANAAEQMGDLATPEK